MAIPVTQPCAHCENRHAKLVTVDEKVELAYGYKLYHFDEYYECDQCDQISVLKRVTSLTPFKAHPATARRIQTLASYPAKGAIKNSA